MRQTGIPSPVQNLLMAANTARVLPNRGFKNAMMDCGDKHLRQICACRRLHFTAPVPQAYLCLLEEAFQGTVFRCMQLCHSPEPLQQSNPAGLYSLSRKAWPLTPQPGPHKVL